MKKKGKYTIYRFFADKRLAKIVARNLTLTEARKWCKNPETSSATATHNKTRGRWFDGYEKEDALGTKAINQTK